MIIKYLLITVLSITVLIILLFISMGMGTFFPAKIIYPYSMISAIPKHNFNTFEIVIAFLQGYLYAIVLFYIPKWKYYLLAIHVIAIIFVFSMNDTTFN